MKILAIETATEACSAALLISDKENNSSNTFVRFELAPREHTKLILPMLDDVIAEGGIELKDVDAIAFGRGPGAFTGLRISAGIAQGIALSVDKPVVPVSTLAALALSVKNHATENQSFVVALDARMNEVYWAEFNVIGDVLSLVGSEQVTSSDEMLESLDDNKNYIATGNGWEAYPIDMPSNIVLVSGNFPSAEYISKLAVDLFNQGESVPAEEAQPVYIRNNVAKKSQKKTAF